MKHTLKANIGHTYIYRFRARNSSTNVVSYNIINN